MSEIPQFLTDPREVRKRLLECRYRSVRIDGMDARGISHPCHILGTVMTAAQMQGLSGEDTMTMVAYHALRAYEMALDQLLDLASMEPPARFFGQPSASPAVQEAPDARA